MVGLAFLDHPYLSSQAAAGHLGILHEIRSLGVGDHILLGQAVGHRSSLEVGLSLSLGSHTTHSSP